MNAIWTAYPFESNLYNAPAARPETDAATDAGTDAASKQGAAAAEEETPGSPCAHAPRFVDAVFVNGILDYAVMQWHCNREFFEVLDRFSLLGERAVRHLVKRCFGARLLDLYLGPHSHPALMCNVVIGMSASHAEGGKATRRVVHPISNRYGTAEWNAPWQTIARIVTYCETLKMFDLRQLCVAAALSSLSLFSSLLSLLSLPSLLSFSLSLLSLIVFIFWFYFLVAYNA